jgi:hypothetical protein
MTIVTQRQSNTSSRCWWSRWPLRCRRNLDPPSILGSPRPARWPTPASHERLGYVDARWSRIRYRHQIRYTAPALATGSVPQHRRPSPDHAQQRLAGGTSRHPQKPRRAQRKPSCRSRGSYHIAAKSAILVELNFLAAKNHKKFLLKSSINYLNLMIVSLLIKSV